MAGAIERLRQGFDAVHALLGELEAGADRLHAELRQGAVRAGEGAEAFAADLGRAEDRVGAAATRAHALGVGVDGVAREIVGGAQGLAAAERARAEGLAGAAGLAAGAAGDLREGLDAGASGIVQRRTGLQDARDPLARTGDEGERALLQGRRDLDASLARTGDAVQAGAGQARGATDAARAVEEALSADLRRDAEATVPEAYGTVRDFVRGPFTRDVERLAEETADRVRRAADGWRREGIERADALGASAAEEHGRVESFVRDELPPRVEEPTRRQTEPQLEDVAESTAENRRRTMEGDRVASEFEPVLPAIQSIQEYAESILAGGGAGGGMGGGGGGGLPASINATETFGDKIIKMIFAKGYQDLDPNYNFFQPKPGEEHLWKRYGDGRWVKVEEGDPTGGAGFRVEDLIRDHGTAEERVAMVRDKGYQDLDPDAPFYRDPDRGPEGDPQSGPAAPPARPSAEDVARMVSEKGYQDLDPGYALYRAPEPQAEVAAAPNRVSPEEVVKMIRDKGYQDLDPGYALFQPPQGQEDQWERSGDGGYRRVPEGPVLASAPEPPAPAPEPERTVSAVDVVRMIREKGYQDLDPAYALFQPPQGQEGQWRRSGDGRWTRA